MTQALELNNLNNIEMMFDLKQKEALSIDFSAIFNKNLSDKKLEDKSNISGSTTNASKNKSDKMDEFHTLLNETTEEANAESSLDLTLDKTLENALMSNEQKMEEKAAIEESAMEKIVLQAQVLETVNQTPAALENNPAKQLELVRTIPQTEIKPLEANQTSESTETQDLQLDEDMISELNIESVESDTGSSGNESSLMNRQSPEEQGIKILINQESKAFEVKVSEPQSQIETKPVEVTPSKIIEQVTKHLETLQNSSKVSIVLNPESLGKITIQLVKSPEGLSAQFTTATQEARSLLMKGLDGLKETLVSHGVGVDNVSVKVNDSSKSEYNSDWTDKEGSRGGNKGQQGRSNKDEKEEGLFERTMDETVTRDS